MASSLMAKYKAAKEAEKDSPKATTKDTPIDTPKRIDKRIFTNTSDNTQFNFMGLWKALGKKKQHNLPLTLELTRLIEEQGGSEYILRILLSDLDKKGKLPEQYRVFLEF
jgi:hypothetical protein